ncbi:MAG: winged helix-turn-helix transcriptional regulator [Candidatus Bathyarchaeota archaeon]|jgi:Lrp/AsnC family leucine-responsive transcriptional regulator|nr:MAG: winged helix-turn-helix transcriptional regulator [Candidatus Bathyarchaeota archaeon]
MKRLKDVDYKILSELFKNARISDRQLAKRINVSQPTVSRRRVMLEKNGLLDYSAIPNLEKLGLEIVAFTFAQVKEGNLRREIEQKITDFYKTCPNVVFATGGRGLGLDIVTISLHGSYSEYAEFARELKAEWGGYVGKQDSFIISLKSDVVPKSLTFRDLIEYLKKMQENEG